MHVGSKFVLVLTTAAMSAHAFLKAPSDRLMPTLNGNLTAFACGTNKTDASPELLLSHKVLRESRDRQLRQGLLGRRQANRIVVDLYIHLIYSASKTNTIPTRMWQAQIAAINQAFRPSTFVFRLVAVDSTVNDAWARGDDTSSMQRTLRRGTYSALNIFFLTDLGRGLIGQCSMPYNIGRNSGGPAAYASDHCLVHAATMPGGMYSSYNQGKTAVHEIGHWLGMFHVFEGASCTGSGDEISDTPAQLTETNGCPVNKDSCPDSPGLDSTNNYMDYSTDACYTMFTPGQIVRMKDLWTLWRNGR